MMKLPLVVALASAGVLLAGPAGAQHLPTQFSPNKPLLNAPPEQQPAALPGAQSSGNTISAGAAKNGLEPNDALFDGVNRGDIATVREALNRGADIDARNVLGLTSVELSVDLGRNDITFLLLSMRSSSGERGPAPRSQMATRAAPPARAQAIQPPKAAPAPRTVAVAPPSPPRSAPAPRTVLSTDPGVPAPQAGFLGFAGPRS